MSDFYKKCFSWGANSCGQLGNGHQDDQLTPTAIELAGFIQDIRSVCGGGGHSLFLTDKGQCYACGSNNRGQLGLDVEEENVLKPQALSFSSGSEKIMKAAAGWDFTILLTDRKKLYGCGSNTFGQLGLEHIKGSIKKPEEITVGPPEEVTDVSCGLRHSILLTGNLDVYTCGAAKKGQLGIEFKEEQIPRSVPVFTKVKLPESCSQVVKVLAGAYHSALLTDQGQVLIWGDNKHGQLTISPSDCSQKNTPYIVPQSCFADRKIVDIFTGWTHMVAITDAGDVYTWGRSEYSQLGHETRESSSDYHPQPLDGISNPIQISTGSEHNLISLDGTLYSWGWNEHGMCGTGDEADVKKPQVVETLKNCHVLTLGCGAGHSFAIVVEKT